MGATATEKPETQAQVEADEEGPAPVPNKWCLVRGTPGVDPLTIIGPFDTADEANTFQANDARESTVPTVVDVLIDPANC